MLLDLMPEDVPSDREVELAAVEFVDVQGSPFPAGEQLTDSTPTLHLIRPEPSKESSRFVS
jgi:hypothetical protein